MQIKAPSGFQPQDVRHRPNPPVPCRSRYRKFDIYRDVQQFNYIDSHAIQVSTTFFYIQENGPIIIVNQKIKYLMYKLFYIIITPMPKYIKKLCEGVNF